MVVWENFNSREDAVFCGVFDGHGPHGHLVARRVRDHLPLKLIEQLEDRNGGGSVAGSSPTSMGNAINPFTGAEAKEIHSEIFLSLTCSFLKAFKLMDKDLRSHRNMDCRFSGTTAVTLIKEGKDVVIGNLGDSRAVLGTRDEKGVLIAVQLTVDQKPDIPREFNRIRKHKGRVFPHPDEPDVARVWLPDRNYPGLAMARAFGDFCLKDYGIICMPDVFYHLITKNDEFIVLASDGVWDVLSNEDVVDIVASAPNQTSAARCLVESAVHAWSNKYPCSKIDDCAAVCLFLNNERSGHCADAADKETTRLPDVTEKSEAINSTLLSNIY